MKRYGLVQMRRTVWLLILVFFGSSLVLTSCATMGKPGNPAYSWLNGRWEGKTMMAAIEADFEVVNDNQVRGSLEYIGVGFRSPGTVSGIISNNKVEFEVYYYITRNTRIYKLEINPDGSLEGTLDGFWVKFQKVK